jgi:hypothetical protein
MTTDKRFWPVLPLEEWHATRETLHMWTQVVGKIRLEQMPLINHWWEVPLYLTARGMTTSIIPYRGRVFQIEFDFLSHDMRIETGEGDTRILPLRPMTVAGFYHDLMQTLLSLGINVPIWTLPVEVENPIPFEADETHRSYDPEFAWRFWRILISTEQVFTRFRSGFQGKNSPVHFFWGGFDLAVTRFSGRKAPEHPPTPLAPASIVVEAYSHEVFSCGFWPGGGPVKDAAYYAYAYPEPAGFRDFRPEPAGAYYCAELGEFILPYETVRESIDPDAVLLRFLATTYGAAADLGGWDRKALEREPKIPHEAIAA